MSRGILIKEERNYELYLLHVGHCYHSTARFIMKSSTIINVCVVRGTIVQCVANESVLKVTPFLECTVEAHHLCYFLIFTKKHSDF